MWRAARAVRAVVAQAPMVGVQVVHAARMMVVQVAEMAMASVIMPVCQMGRSVVVRKVSHTRMLLLPMACSRADQHGAHPVQGGLVRGL